MHLKLSFASMICTIFVLGLSGCGLGRVHYEDRTPVSGTFDEFHMGRVYVLHQPSRFYDSKPYGAVVPEELASARDPSPKSDGLLPAGTRLQAKKVFFRRWFEAGVVEVVMEIMDGPFKGHLAGVQAMTDVKLGGKYFPNPRYLDEESTSTAYSLGSILHENLLNNLSQWHIESEQPGTITAEGGTLSIDVPRGCTVWFAHELSGPVLIQYDACMMKADPPGPNDRVSDLNCFWMATDPRAKSDAAEDFFNVPQRTGAFASYDQLKTYYVGQGGNTNSTTRFRRYIGTAGNRPLLPEHDLTSQLLTPNQWQTIRLVACNNLIEYYRDGTRIFQYTDAEPCTHGYFGIRTTFNHMEIKNLTIRRLIP